VSDARRCCRVRGCHRHQVCCTHPRHPNPRKQYALKLIINYATLSDARDIAERCGRDGIVLRILPRHTNLCAVLAEFISEVPDEMFEYLTPVRLCALCCTVHDGSRRMSDCSVRARVCELCLCARGRMCFVQVLVCDCVCAHCRCRTRRM
jgi:hypothetical protein